MLCPLELLWPEMGSFKDINFFCPRTQKCNISTAHLAQYYFNDREVGHGASLCPYIPTKHSSLSLFHTMLQHIYITKQSKRHFAVADWNQLTGFKV